MQEKKKSLPEAPRSSKKVKIIGTETYIRQATGEAQEFNVIDIEDRDANFSKLWIGHILEAVDQLGNAKMKVMMHIIAKRDPTSNNLIATSQEIADAVGVSEKTVRETIKALVTAKVVTRRKGINGVLMLNPEVVFKGQRSGRLNVLLRYREWTQAALPGFEEPEQETAQIEPEAQVHQEAA